MLLKKKKELLAQNPGRDQPIMKQLLYSSMIWDKYGFNDGDDVEFGKELNISDDGKTIETEKAKRISEFTQQKKLNEL